MAALLLAGGTLAAGASRPVARTIVGCVADGTLTSNTGYVIKVVAPGARPIDLKRLNGLSIRFRGMLLPGDRLVVRTEPIVLGPCRTKLPSLQRSGNQA